MFDLNKWILNNIIRIWTNQSPSSVHNSMTIYFHKHENAVAPQPTEVEWTPAIAQCRDLVAKEDFQMDKVDDPVVNRTTDEAL